MCPDQDLIGRCFDRSEDTRASIDDILKHPWCQRQLPAILQNKLNYLAGEQAKIDSESDRPRYCVADGDKQVAHFVEQIFSEEYGIETKKRWPILVDRMMLTWSGLPHEHEGLPPSIEGSAAKPLASARAASKRSTDASAASKAVGWKEGSSSGPREEDPSGYRASAPASAVSAEESRSLHSNVSTATSGSPSPRSGTVTPRAGQLSAAAAAPYKSRARLSSLLIRSLSNGNAGSMASSQQDLSADPSGWTVSAWSPHRVNSSGPNPSAFGCSSPPRSRSVSGAIEVDTFLDIPGVVLEVDEEELASAPLSSLDADRNPPPPAAGAAGPQPVGGLS